MYYTKIKKTIEKANSELHLLYKDIPYFIYNPLEYCLDPFIQYLEKGGEKRDIVFLGMNPGPFGMMQNGIPFGASNFVNNYLNIEKDFDKQKIEKEHPKYKIIGKNIERQEISGTKLWGLIQSFYPDSNTFLENQIVLNYLQLAILDKEKGKNITPDKLNKDVRTKIENICDNQLREILDILESKVLIGVGKYSYDSLLRVKKNEKVIKINHPSPLNARYFKTWTEDTKKLLIDENIWK